MPTPDLRLAKAEWSAGKRVSGGSGRGDEAVLAQHFDPARRVALNVQRLVIDLLVLVVAAVAEHGVDGAQHLVGQRHH